MTYLFGCDPEVFVHDGGKFIPAHGMIQGTKEEPYKVRNGAVQVDGLALEFNIDPVASREDWLRNIRSVEAQLRDMIDPKFNLRAVPSADFVKDDFINLPPAARVLGCDPDYNAYSGERNKVPADAGNEPYRCAGGHVHIGWLEPDSANLEDQVHIHDCSVVVKAMDVTLGLLSCSFDTDKRRSNVYGGPGAYRVKPYGVEYRTLSNAWLATDDRVNWVFDTAKLTMEILEKDPKFFKLNDGEAYNLKNAVKTKYKYYVTHYDLIELRRRLEKAGFKKVA